MQKLDHRTTSVRGRPEVGKHKRIAFRQPKLDNGKKLFMEHDSLRYVSDGPDERQRLN
jgi:hypothetical protein